MTNKLSVLTLLIFCILLSSCSSKFTLTKRRYTKGYYFAHAASTAVKEKETHTAGKNRPETAVHQEKAMVLALAENKPESSAASEQVITEKKVSKKQKLADKIKRVLPRPELPGRMLQAASALKHKTEAESAPYDWGSGGGWGSPLAFIGGFILTLLFILVWFLFMEALFDGTLPLWLFGFIGIGVAIAVVVILLLVAMNSD